MSLCAGGTASRARPLGQFIFELSKVLGDPLLMGCLDGVGVWYDAGKADKGIAKPRRLGQVPRDSAAGEASRVE